MTTLFENEIVSYFQSLKSKIILVAFSGGADSTALLDALYRHRETLSLSLIACHVHHGIRGNNADKDAAFCQQYCESRNILFHMIYVDVPKFATEKMIGIESAARELRYKALFQCCEDQGADHVATAHHLDDRVETFFIKLAQGCSVLNSAGFNLSGTLIRPLLNIKKQQIYDYLSHFSVHHIVDESNFSKDYLRNWVREEMMPAVYEKDGFLENVVAYQKSTEQLKSYFDDKIAHVDCETDLSGVTHFSRQQFLALHSLEQKHLLSIIFNKRFRVETRHIETAIGLIEQNLSKRVDLPGDTILESSIQSVRLYSKKHIEPFEYMINHKKDDFFIEHLKKWVSIQRFSDKDTLVIRNRRNGDRFLDKKLKDIFIDKKVELFIRDTSVVLECNHTIIWVEHISKDNNQIQIKYEA